MQSPFKVFRKHQKIVLAGLTLMAMIGFGLGDVLTKMGRGGSGRASSKDVVETNIGSLSQMEMSQLVAQRSVVHRFIVLAYFASHPELNFMAGNKRMTLGIIAQYGFGGDSRPDLLDAWLYRHEARKMGIVVSDEQIRNYIKNFTEAKFMPNSPPNRLSTDRFSAILDQLGLSPKELFGLLREELQGDIARRMKVPAFLPSPEKFWEYYQQLNTRQKIEVAALPVEDFTAAVPDPVEKQIVSLFEKHKVDFEQASGGVFRPGFRQPEKVKLHSLVLSRNAVDDQVAASGPIADKEIEDYYERNKDTDMRFYEFEADEKMPSDTTPIDPQFAPEKGPSLDGDSKDSSKVNPEKSEASSGTDDAAKSPANDKDESGDAAKEDAGADKRKADCSSAGANEDDAKDEEKSAATEPSRDGTAKKAAVEFGAEGGSAEKTGSDDDEFVPESPALPEGADDDQGAKTGGKKAPPKKKYKPLDDNLREQIRDSVLNDRRRKFLQAEKDKAVEAFRDLGLRFSTASDIKLTDPKPEELKLLQQRSEDKLRKIAASLGMKFIETGLVSREGLREVPGLGSAFEFGLNESPRIEMTTIVDQAFENESLCRVFVSEGLGGTIYISWKVQFSATHIPTLDEPGIREQVVKAWKRIEALPLAKKRAEELAERARQQKNDLETGLKDQTVTGDAKGLSLFVRESPEFSFYHESFAPNPMQNRGTQVQIGNPIVVTNPGRNFMRTVFDIADGKIDIALNDDASVYYLVKVVSRRPADRAEFQQAIDKLFIPGSPYMEVAGFDVRETGAEYSRMMDEKYAIRWNDLPTRESFNPVFDDE
jgi:hypothetical protein